MKLSIIFKNEFEDHMKKQFGHFTKCVITVRIIRMDAHASGH